MTKHSRSFHYPSSVVRTEPVGAIDRGCDVILHWQVGATLPCLAELTSAHHDVFITLFFDRERKFYGFGGIEQLPAEVTDALIQSGFQVRPRQACVCA